MRPYAPGREVAPGVTVTGPLLHRSNRQDVYPAFDAHRRCPVVAKVVRPDRRGEEVVRADLVQEGELLRRLAHPHLARAYAVHDAPDRPTPCVVLEVLGGQTLERVVATAPRPASARQAALLGLQVGSALSYLHAEGLVHLDVKASNVIVDGARAVLLDLSHAAPPGPQPAGRGTWSTQAPEQARGGEIGPPADVWALGLLLRDVLTGEHVLEEIAEELDDDHPQLAARVPRLRTARPRVPAALAAIVDGCLEPEAADRPVLDAVLDTLDALAP